MTVTEIVALAAERGLRLEVGHDGAPRLRGPREEVTPALVAVLRLYREEIVEALRPAPPREWLWRFGQTYVETPDDPRFGREDSHPAGAWWWRRKGERLWSPVPGRNPDGLPAPAGEEVGPCAA